MAFQRRKVAAALAYLAGVGTAGLLLTAVPASAQDMKVNVTGTNVKRVDTETGSPVTVITREEIEQTGATSVQDLLQYAADTDLRLLYVGKVVLDKERARQFGVKAGEEWVYAIGIRVETTDAGAGDTTPPGRKGAGAATRPICVTRLYLSPTLKGIEARLRERKTAVYALIERDYKVSIQRVEQDLQGALLDADDAANLGAQPGAPALRIVRRYYDSADRLLEVAENIHPADRFTYRMHLRK